LFRKKTKEPVSKKAKITDIEEEMVFENNAFDSDVEDER